MTARFCKLLSLVVMFIALTLTPGCRTNRNPDAGVIHLLSGDDLSGYYAFLDAYGGQHDPNCVFSMSNGVLRISGQDLGNLTTEREYSNYRLVAEFKWGDTTWKPRQFKARDSGIIFNMVGAWRVLPEAIRCQIVEGGTGSVVVMSGATVNTNGVMIGPAETRIDRPGRKPWKDELGFRGTNEIENPPGEWNTVEIVNAKGRVVVTVNGHKTFEGTDAKPRKGKISLQSDGAEIFFRKLDLYPVK